MPKVTVEATFDRSAYAPGDWIRIIAMVHGDRPDRLYGGRARLFNRIEVTAQGTREMRDWPKEKRLWTTSRFHDKVLMQQIEPLPDGTPRIWCDLRLPEDAAPTAENELFRVEWWLRVDARRRGPDIGVRVPIAVVPRGEAPA